MKHYMTAFLVLLILQPMLSADELILKDGKKIEFKSLSDEGDHYEVTTPQGNKVTVQKEDVEKLAPAIRVATALTGATFTFDKKRKLDTVDLLARIDPKKDGTAGNWKFAAGVLNCGKTDPSIAPRLQISAFTEVPEEYDLTLAIERKEPGDWLGLMLIGGGKQFAFFFDAHNSTYSGLANSEGNVINSPNELSVPGVAFVAGKPRTIVFMVRKEAFIVKLDGKDFLTWKADWSKAYPSHFLTSSGKNTINISTHASTWAISKIVLTVPKQ
jgi:hypothetical protein